jgi:hypothetical protein
VQVLREKDEQGLNQVVRIETMDDVTTESP